MKMRFGRLKAGLSNYLARSLYGRVSLKIKPIPGNIRGELRQSFAAD